MSAADRVVRMRDGSVRVVRAGYAAALVAARRAQIEPRRRSVPRTVDATPELALTPTAAAPVVQVDESPVPLDATPDDVGVEFDDVPDEFPEPGAPDDAETIPALCAPSPRATKAVWTQYAESLGVVVPDDMTKPQIQAAAAEVASGVLDRLPQPALMGGRLATPEDEPESGADHDDGTDLA